MSSVVPTVYLVDDDDDLRHALAQGLELEELEVTVHERADQVLNMLDREDYGMALLKKILAIDPVIPITGHGDVQLAVEAMRLGAYDFIEKPFPVSRLSAVIERSLEKRRLVMENRSLRNELDQKHDLTHRLAGRSPGILRLRREIEAVTGTDVDGNFVAINCAALPADIFESELFGHESGAFTGAQKQRIGKLEHANGGTIFLDEIESMPLDLQAKPLQAIEQHSIERLGSNRTISLDVRFVAATKFDLEKEGAAGRFRADLYYRLNVITLTIPPLRQRKDDIPLLFFHLARDAQARYRREIPDIDHTLESQLLAHDWPGNVRELRNYAERHSGGNASLSERVAAFEKATTETELTRHGGSMKPVYEALGISRKGLYDKIRRHGINVDGTD